MKMAFIALTAAAYLTGCATMTEREKQWTGAIIGAVVVGAVAAHRGNGAAQPSVGTVGPPPSCFPQPDGSCR